MPVTNYAEFAEQFYADARSKEPMRPRRGVLQSTAPLEDPGSVTDEPAPLPSAAADPCTFGDILFIPNHFWGFDVPDPTHHPGVCVHRSNCITATAANSVLFCKGTDASKVKPRYRINHVFIESSAGNGLTMQTAFNCTPRPIKSHRVRLLYKNQYAGRLDQAAINLLWRKVYWQTHQATRA